MPSLVRPRIAILEPRESERVPTALMAFALGQGGARFPCCIRNVSDTGALLEFLGTEVVTLPPKFDLVLANDARFTAKVVWREGRRAGVLFCL
ncbi:PilZ domain-containing protein [Methylobacterium soli]|uniref:PilZ domain-containing protein n=1 Tax=Methylobacterium soli TaxID=553447 RepID=A0A6L3SVM3_9HYPH|nr:PilZ domain-containing protein [Methylobacterium soli]KAB1076590.1 PilZ domain-containing protein [Methylobacterium soli]GJE44499.1 hypothetical protein AEGHOMDF_3687 [Methylobacterium soli]